MSNVRFWCEKRGVPVTDELCQAILARAKSCAWTLTDDEVWEVIGSFGIQRKPTPPKKSRKSRPAA